MNEEWSESGVREESKLSSEASCETEYILKVLTLVCYRMGSVGIRA